MEGWAVETTILGWRGGKKKKKKNPPSEYSTVILKQEKKEESLDEYIYMCIDSCLQRK
jgi:hypothetical protein